MEVVPLGDADRKWRDEALERAWGSTSVARRGAVVDASRLPGFVAVIDGERAGLLTYDRCGDDVEVVTLHVDTPGRGTGRALMDSLRGEAERTAARRIWLVTTNDNTRAYRFYQRWGMDLVAFHADGVTESRRVKPSIPIVGDDGIPVRHELEFELRL